MEYKNTVELQDNLSFEKVVFEFGFERMDVTYLNRFKGSDELFLSQMISVRYGTT